MSKKYFLVYAKCGHVKRSQYIEKSFPISANNKKEAAQIARQKSRVKHHDKYAIKDVIEISKEEYFKQVKIFKEDNYHKVSSVQEQKAYCPDIYLETKKEEIDETYKRTNLRRHLIDDQIAKEMENSKYRYYERD